MKQRTNSLETKAIDEIMWKLGDHISEIESLQEDLAEAIECWMDESEDTMAEMELYLEDALKDREINEMLYMELNAGRKELLRLINCLNENGIEPSGEQYIHYSRLNPDDYEQDPGSPFCLELPDDHFRNLIQDQYEHLQEFEKITPMTTQERDALRRHVIHDTGLQSDNVQEWVAFLKGYRARQA